MFADPDVPKVHTDDTVEAVKIPQNPAEAVVGRLKLPAAVVVTAMFCMVFPLQVMAPEVTLLKEMAYKDFAEELNV